MSDQKPYLMRGADVADYLRKRNAKRKQPCGDGRIYCLPCRAPKRPAGDMVDLERTSEASGTLVGICPDCDRVIRRHVSLVRLKMVASGLDVSVRDTGGESTLGNVINPPVNRGSSEVENP
ncbi:hypothetical protein ACKTEK_13290 [Tepidamorphus sp. 3E244]|uniref:hypothetical protein n=1 Tax=Tepidamorphus sp. 3E244 TaxID=3385498 RepID=UPI0038FC016C